MITEKKHEERLKSFGLNIKTKYKSLNNVLERNTDGSKNDNVPEGVILSKQYFYRGQVIHKENIFDSRIIYKFEFNHGDKEQKCPNCGSPIVIKRGRFGEFKACSNYPKCKTIIKETKKTDE